MKNSLLMGLIVLLLCSVVFADDLERTSAQLFEQVMSPYCPGMTLSACPSDDARILRDEVRSKLEKGESPDIIKAELKSRFGNLSGAPRTGASGSLAYLGIMVFFVIGLGIIGLNIKRSGNKDVQAES